MRPVPALLLTLTATALAGSVAQAAPIGAAIARDGVEIVPGIETGIQFDRAPTIAAPASIFLSADVHAAKDESHGFTGFIPYLSISFTLTRDGDPTYKKTGLLYPTATRTGPRYIGAAEMAGPGVYHLTYLVSPPSAHGMYRLTGRDSGVPDWWKPITAKWDFPCPASSSPNQASSK
ncbi:MAG TPA: iron transporter [Rhizomicrobium sp.]|nr:iron transporter [Rhizomicrobium sp.]